MTKPITLIVACATNRVIGRAGQLPFDIPEDKTWFHDKTAGATVVLGRVCFETWPRATADGRQPIVITSQPDRIIAARDPGKRESPTGHSPSDLRASLQPSVPLTASSVSAALALAQTLSGEIMVCGGQRIYEETLPLASRLVLTLVHATITGDTFFPDWQRYSWRETWRRESQDANYRYTFLILEK